MSGECDDCGEHTLECFCKSQGKYVFARTCGTGCPCRFKEHYTHLNLVRTDMQDDPFGGIDTPAEIPAVKYINVRGRVEHEAILKDAEWCKELGLDQMYEVMVYLKRWGNWLGD